MAKGKGSGSRQGKKENVAERVVDELESRFLAAAEVATATTSAEENLVTAGVEAIVGHHDQDTSAKPRKSRKSRPVKAKRRR